MSNHILTLNCGISNSQVDYKFYEAFFVNFIFCNAYLKHIEKQRAPNAFQQDSATVNIERLLAPRGEEFNPGPETRLDLSELLCNKVLLKYKGDRESSDIGIRRG